MKSNTNRSRARLGTALAALAIGLGSITAAAPVSAAPKAGTFRPSQQVLLSTGEGQVVRLPSSVADVWTSNPAVADVYVSNARQINLFGKESGEATVIATAANGSVVYSANVRVSQNITSVDQMLRAAMPQADIKVLNAGQIAVLTGTVASPNEAAQAEQLVSAMLNPGVDMSKAGAMCKVCVVNRLNTELTRAASRPDVREKYTGLALDFSAMTADQYAAFIKEQSAKFGKVIREAGITAKQQ